MLRGGCMQLKNSKYIFLLFLGVSFIFFYKFFLGKIPFPGDLLTAEYSPWRYYSFLGFTPGSFPNKAQYFDVLRQLYPWTTLVISSLKQGIFPLWNPFSFSGAPLFANSQSAVLYPLHILYFLLPQTVAWGILVMLQPLLISIFTYLYTRKIGLQKSSRILSTLAFSYSLFTTVFLEYNTFGHAVFFLPLLLFLAELLLEKKTFWRILIFILVLGSLGFVGHLQLFGFVFLFVIVYILFRIRHAAFPLKQLGFFCAALVLGLGIGAVQLVPTLELIQFSARVSQEYSFLLKNLLIQPYQLLLFFAPDLFGNPTTRNYLLSDSYPGNALSISTIPLIFAFLALPFFKKNEFVRFYSITSLVLLCLFVNTPFTELLYKLQIPFFSTGSPTNALFLLGFSLSMLAGFGMMSVKWSKYVWTVLAMSLIVFLGGIIGLKAFHIPYSVKNFYYSFGIYILGVLTIAGFTWSKGIRKTFFIVCLVLLTIADLFYFFQKFNPFVPTSLVFPPTSVITYLQKYEGINRFWGFGAASLEPNVGIQYKLYDTGGYDPLYPKWYGEFLQSSNDGRIHTTFTNKTRSDAVIASNFGAEEFAKSMYRKKVLDFLGVKYIIDRVENGTTQETFPPEQYMLTFTDGGWKIYENKHVLPRVFIAYKTTAYANEKDFENKFFSNNFNPRTTLLLKKSLPTMQEGEGNVTVKEYSLNKIVLSSKSTTKGILFLSDTYFPGWKAYVDGKENEILKADYAFRAVSVPEGEHTVVFAYQPFSFYLGITLTIISLGLGVLFAFFVKRK